MTTATIIGCDVCGKSPFKDRRGLNTHKQFHCKGEAQPKKIVKKKSAAESKEKSLCDCEDGGNWSILKRSDEQHALAIALGYTKICERCETVK